MTALNWFGFVCVQAATKASYVAATKTVRQVKTVFIIFTVFACCWSPYIVVVLYDRSDRLPLPVHLYTSMLAHLHASINFAIYGLMNPHLRGAFFSLLSPSNSWQRCFGRRLQNTPTERRLNSRVGINGSFSLANAQRRNTFTN